MRKTRHVEHDIQEAVAQYLNIALPADAFWTSIDHGSQLGATPKQAATRWARLKRRGVKTGLPDIWILWRGKLFVFELKRSASQKLSQSQSDTMGAMTVAGLASWTLTSTVAGVECVLLRIGMHLRARVSA